MPDTIPLRKRVKQRAKRLMLHPLSLRVTLLVVGAQLGLFLLRVLCNGTLRLTMASLANYGETASGLYVLEEGVNLIFRMDLTGTVAALSVTYGQMAVFAVVNVVVFLLLAPLRLGAMEVYWSLSRGKTDGAPGQVLRWFREKNRMVKAWVVELCLQAGVGAVAFIASLPALYLFYRFYSITPDFLSIDLSRRLLLWTAELLAAAAMCLALLLHSLLLPVRYCLASHPEYGLGEIFRRGFRSARGFRKRFYGFRLTYLVWFFLSRLTYGAMDFFVLPYSSLGSMLYLQQAPGEMAREEAQARAPQPPLRQVREEGEEDYGAAWPPAGWRRDPEENVSPAQERPAAPHDSDPAPHDPDGAADQDYAPDDGDLWGDSPLWPPHGEDGKGGDDL